jgi:hypothetical protein
MKKQLSLIISLAAVGSVFAQNLDTTNVADQFSAGSRSDQANGATWSAPTYADITGSINYFSTFGAGTATSNPVLDVTAVQTQDGVTAIPAVAANTGDTSSTSNQFSLYVGDGGGGQNLQWGQITNANYYVATAFYCEQRTLAPPDADPLQGWERVYVTVRCPQLSTTSNIDAIGGYALNFETDSGKVQAVKWNPANAAVLTVAQVRARDAAARQVFAEQVLSNGWHRFEVSARNSTITFKVDGVQLAQVTDTTYAAGAPGLSYRENFTDGQQERQGKFDYQFSGPSPVPPPVNAAKDWQIYQ